MSAENKEQTKRKREEDPKTAEKENPSSPKKAKVEATKEEPKYKIYETVTKVEMGNKTVVGKMVDCKAAEIGMEIGKAYEALGKLEIVGKLCSTPGKLEYVALNDMVDMVNDRFVFIAGVLGDTVDLVGDFSGFEVRKLDRLTCMCLTHKGEYKDSGNTWKIIGEYIAEKGIKNAMSFADKGNTIESYLNDPFEAAKNGETILTNCCWILKNE